MDVAAKVPKTPAPDAPMNISPKVVMFQCLGIASKPGALAQDKITSCNCNGLNTAMLADGGHQPVKFQGVGDTNEPVTLTKDEIISCKGNGWKVLLLVNKKLKKRGSAVKLFKTCLA